VKELYISMTIRMCSNYFKINGWLIFIIYVDIYRWPQGSVITTALLFIFHFYNDLVLIMHVSFESTFRFELVYFNILNLLM
jgi:hypothetical protein